MKLRIKRSEARVFDEHGVSNFSEYNLPFTSFSTGVSEINGRYPRSGFDVDLEVDASWYVVAGKGKLNLQNKNYDLSEGDMVFIPKGEKYWIEGESLKLVVTSCPKWFPEQHKHIEN